MEDDVHAAFDAAIAKSVKLCEDFLLNFTKIKDYLNNLKKINDIACKLQIVVSVSLDLPKEIVGQFSWRLSLGRGAIQFDKFDKREHEISFISFKSVITSDSPESRAIILEVFKSMPKLLKDLESQANFKSGELSKLINSVIFGKD